MSFESVKKYLKKFNLDDRVLAFDCSSATVALAAKAVGCTESQIAKSMSFNVNDKTIIVVLAGDCKVDNAKFKQTFNVKAKMLSFDEVENKTNHKVGGVCPFDLKEDVKVYLDNSLKRFDFVYPACGSDNSAVKLTNDDLEKASQNFVDWVDVSKLIEQ